MPKLKIETVYAFIQFINCQADEIFVSSISKKKARSILSIAKEYANPELIEKEEGTFECAMVKNKQLINTNKILRRLPVAYHTLNGENIFIFKQKANKRLSM